jgi:hypothetical protein
MIIKVGWLCRCAQWLSSNTMYLNDMADRDMYIYKLLPLIWFYLRDMVPRDAASLHLMSAELPGPHQRSSSFWLEWGEVWWQWHKRGDSDLITLTRWSKFSLKNYITGEVKVFLAVWPREQAEAPVSNHVTLFFLTAGVDGSAILCMHFDQYRRHHHR